MEHNYDRLLADLKEDTHQYRTWICKKEGNWEKLMKAIPDDASTVFISKFFEVTDIVYENKKSKGIFGGK
jgi:hypothetical protein